MLILRIYRQGSRWGPYIRSLSTFTNLSSYKLCKYFSVNENRAELICLKQPYIHKLDETMIENLIETVQDLGFAKDVLIHDPALFGIMPITLKFRYKVLKECGFEKITPNHLSSYLPIMRQKTIANLKESGELPNRLNVEKNLASFLTQWPVTVNSLTFGDNHLTTLYNLRLKILQRYLELILDLTEDEFEQGLKTYPTIKHRPLQVINETLHILQSVVTMPDKKIKANLYLIHADPENLKQIIYNFRSIGGIEIKEILRLHPKLVTKKYDVMVEIRNILHQYGISDEAQRRCFAIYTLGPDTIRERLEEAKSIPEFQAFLNHPRFLKMIYYKNTAMQRLKSLYDNKKQCLSLNVLSGCSAHYEAFQNSPGDRLGKGKDLVFCIAESLGNIYSSNQIWKMIKRHPFWFNIPLMQVKSVVQELSKNYDIQDIYENCNILLYPLEKIMQMISILEEQRSDTLYSNELLDVTKLNKSQILSLVVYFLEKNHYFTGNGVWTEEKGKNVAEIYKTLKQDETVKIKC